MATQEMTMDPRTRDWLRQEAGRGLDQGKRGTTNDHLARVLGVDPSDTSRRRNGVPGRGSGVEAAFFEEVHTLAADPKLSPYPMIARAIAVAQTGLCEMTDCDLVRRWRLLTDEESERECVENGARSRLAWDCDLEGLAEADIAHAFVQLELAGIEKEMVRRGLNPMEVGNG